MALKNRFFKISYLSAIVAISVSSCYIAKIVESKKSESKYEETTKENKAKNKSSLKEDKLSDDDMVVDNFDQDIVNEMNATEPPPEEVTQASLMGFTPIPPSKEVAGIDYRAYLDYNNFLNYCVVQSDAYVNVRKEAKADAQVIGKMPPNGGGLVLEHVTAADGAPWVKVKSGEVEGYIKSEFLKFDKEALALISSVGRMHVVSKSNNLNIRVAASTDSQVITQMNQGEACEIASVNGEWIEIYVDTMNGSTSTNTAFVKAEFVDFAFRLKDAINIQINFNSNNNRNNESVFGIDAPSTYNSIREELVKYACGFCGCNYKKGGNELTTEAGKGTDCSGFVKLMFAHFGIKMKERKAHFQCKVDGITITKEQLLPGDLIFFENDSDSEVDHVAIYIGNGKMVHSRNTKYGIGINGVNYDKKAKIVRYARMIED